MTSRLLILESRLHPQEVDHLVVVAAIGDVDDVARQRVMTNVARLNAGVAFDESDGTKRFNMKNQNEAIMTLASRLELEYRV